MIETIILKSPIKINGELRKEFKYDLDELSIDDVCKAETLKTKLGSAAMTHPIFDYSMHVAIAMKAIQAVNSDISEEDLLRIKGSDIQKLAKAGLAFFAESEEQEEKNSDEQEEVMPDIQEEVSEKSSDSRSPNFLGNVKKVLSK